MTRVTRCKHYLRIIYKEGQISLLCETSSYSNQPLATSAPLQPKHIVHRETLLSTNVGHPMMEKGIPIFCQVEVTIDLMEMQCTNLASYPKTQTLQPQHHISCSYEASHSTILTSLRRIILAHESKNTTKNLKESILNEVIIADI